MDKTYHTQYTPTEVPLDEHITLKGPITFLVDLHRLDDERDAFSICRDLSSHNEVLRYPMVKVVMTSYVPLSQVQVTIP